MKATDVKEAKRQLEALPEMLKADHWVSLAFPLSEKKGGIRNILFPSVLSLLQEVGVGADLICGGVKWSDDNRKATLGFCVRDAVDPLFNGFVVGPDACSVMQAGRFRKMWGNRCELRRFQDGTVRESVQIFPPVKNVADVPLEVDASDFVVNKFAHLLNVHHPEVEMSVERPLRDQKQLLKDCLERRRVTMEHRRKTERLVTLLRNLSSDDLPIRQVSACCGCLYGGHHPGRHVSVSVPRLEDGDLKEKSACIPPRVRFLPVYVEITSKLSFDRETFDRLSLFHLLKVKEVFSSKFLLRSAMLRDALVVEFEGSLFGLQTTRAGGRSGREGAPPPPKQREALGELLHRIGSDHPCWWGALALVREWSSCNFLETDLPDGVADLALAASIAGTSAGSAAPKLLGLDPPSSIEAAFLRFLYLLSFADFENTLFIVKREECADVPSTVAAFNAQRKSLPALCLVTPRDELPSSFTRKLTSKQLRRVVNAARMTLFEAMKTQTPAFNFNGWDQSSAYDFVVKLKPFKTEKEQQHPVSHGLPVLAFDAVGLFLEELDAAFGGLALFHFSSNRHAVGVKLFDVTEIDIVIEDVKVVGKGIIDDIIITKTEMFSG